MQTSVRDPLQLLDWIVSRHVHEYLDVAGRPVGEGRAAAFRRVQTKMQACPYAGNRNHHAKPMNVSALLQILPAWGSIVTTLSWLARRCCTWRQTEITTYTDLALVAGAGGFLTDFLVLRRRRPLGSGEIPVLISGLYKVCLGFQLATFLDSMRERFGANPVPEELPDAAGFYDCLEAHELLVGEAEVCAGPPAMIREAYDAMTGRNSASGAAPPAECAALEIDWERFDRFALYAADIWNDLVLYVIQESQFYPELADERLPPDVQSRLNACLQRRKAELLEGQRGLVVEIARAGLAYGIRPAVSRAEPLEQFLPQQASLAASVVAWLDHVAPADMRTYAPVVAECLQARLAPYDLYEANLVAGLNQHLSCLADALGLGAPGAPLTARALSQVCGRTLRDWEERTS